MKQLIYVTLGTLAETNDGTPESMLYIGVCGSDIHKWEQLKGILLMMELITISGNFVTLTSKGKELGDKINEADQILRLGSTSDTGK